MPRLIFELVRDSRGSLVHVGRRDDGECVGCIEVGLYEIVRSLVLEEVGAAEPRSTAAPLKKRTGGQPVEEEALNTGNRLEPIERQRPDYGQAAGVVRERSMTR
jgi:hypothetical protein